MKHFWRRAAAFFLMLIVLSLSCGCNVPSEEPTVPKEPVEDSRKKFNVAYYDYFDTVSTVVGYEETKEAFEERAEFVRSELERYNKLYDIYHSYSGVNNVYTLNREAAKGPVAVDDDVIALLKFGKEVYEKTGGMTNIAMGGVLSIWHEYQDEGNDDPFSAALPPMEDLLAASEHCNIDDVVIDEEAKTIFFADPLLQLDVGAVAKGYATERIARDLMEQGTKNYALNIGGNVRTLGPKTDGSGWVAGIQNPDLSSEKTYIRRVLLDGKTLVTSGTYQRYYYVDGVRYHHIIHPETLMPENSYTSVSILNEDSGWADALSTACFNLSLEDGMALIASFPDTEAMWVEADGTQHFSERFSDYLQETE